jgi:hypothetical protein
MQQLIEPEIYATIMSEKVIVEWHICERLSTKEKPIQLVRSLSI